jgi:hypothetical protein
MSFPTPVFSVKVKSDWESGKCQVELQNGSIEEILIAMETRSLFKGIRSLVNYPLT